MNKFQREKSKRMKKLSSLGIVYHKQKKFIKMFDGDFDKLDRTLAQIEKITNKKLTMFDHVKKVIINFLTSFKNKVFKN